ncbi:phage tail protein [Escherichia sp. E1130]|uniref:gp53-like domain-containing protein n=1 Tax=Escherichia sp. E1130 TaxID=2041645 RepID=UPI00108130D3|nr:phage tail protein [Escherichia sp. E1130]TGC25271.1 phage tail protein [Escherichia sp. E1130]
MANKNDFKAFALDPNANVMSQAEWEALPALLSGFMAGKASSAQVNKAIRQASFIAASLAQYIANKSGQDVLDDGDLNGFITKMTVAFGKDFQALDATLTALAALATGANKLPYFTGIDTAAQTDLTQVGRDIIGKTDIPSVLTYLGLKTAAQRDVGTGTNQIPDMSSFTSSIGPNGYMKLPGGLMIQWGNFGGNGTSGNSGNYPIPFTSAVYAAFGVISDPVQLPTNTSTTGVNFASMSLTSWGANVSAAGTGTTYRYNYLVIGR